VYTNEELVARVRELWERNLTQKEMLRVLAEEGYDINDRNLARLRTKHGLLLRVPVLPLRGQSADRGDSIDAEDHQDDGEHGDHSEGGQEDIDGTSDGHGMSGFSPADAQVQNETFEAFRQAYREERKRRLEAEYYERWAAKKRRRHTKPYAGLPADPPGPPRFPSETTLAEAKEILQLDAAAYRTVRDKFYAICENAGVVKKTLAGPEKWEALKDQLVRESMHLRAAMWDPTDMEQKKLAIDIIACDVTKRIRTANSAISLPEAKTILGLNPEQARELREAFCDILAKEKFTAKLEEGLEYFEALKQKWIAESELLSRVVASEHTDPDYRRKMKAINVICRNASNRYRDEKIRLSKPQPDPKPVRQRVPKPKKATNPARKPPTQAVTSPARSRSSAAAVTPAQEVAQASAQASAQAPAQGAPGDAPVETPAETPAPAPQPRKRGRPKGSKTKKALPLTEARLVLADAPESLAGQESMGAQRGDNTLLAPQVHDSFLDGPYEQGYDVAAQQAKPGQQAAPSGAIAVFFRLRPESAAMFPGIPTQWICPLSSPSIAEVRAAAVEKAPGAVCLGVEGIIKDGKGGELPLPVSDEAELVTYLQHVQGYGAPTFNVHIAPGGPRQWE
jgi:hypothetical protein